MKFGGVILGMKKLEIGLVGVGVGAVMFIGAIALQDTIAVIGFFLFTFGFAFAMIGVGD
jgi:hypothetical protein